MELGANMYKEMKDIFFALGQDALYKSHYELHEMYPEYPVNAWRSFLGDEEISEYVDKERTMLSDVELNKLMHNAASKGGQVGTAQLITAMAKTKQQDNKKTGPAFIYMAVPLNDTEKKRKEIQQLDEDPFKVKE